VTLIIKKLTQRVTDTPKAKKRQSEGVVNTTNGEKLFSNVTIILANHAGNMEESLTLTI
jgi:hypothetical protein